MASLPSTPMMRRDFGDVTAEYEALRSGGGFVEGFSEFIWVRGSDAVSFLDGQLSQDLAGMRDGSTARSLLLEPRGKLVAPLWVLRGADEIGLVVDAGFGVVVEQHLARFRFRVDATIEVDPTPVFEVWGPNGVEAAQGLGLAPGVGWTAADDGSAIASLVGTVLHRLVIAAPDPSRLLDLGLLRCGSIAADTVRIEAGEPVMGRDLDDTTIPQESGLVPAAVSFTKGCYVGQELVARIDTRGHVNRRLMGLAVQTNTIPPEHAEVVNGGSVVGSVSTVGESLAVGAPVALAMVRREVAAGDTVDITWPGGTARATVRDLPMDRLGVT